MLPKHCERQQEDYYGLQDKPRHAKHQSTDVSTCIYKNHHGWGVTGVCSGCLPAAVEACRPLGQLNGATVSPQQAVLYCQPRSSPPAPANPELTLWPAGGCAGMQGAICMAVLKVMVPARGRVGQLLVGSVVFAELL